MSGLLFLGVVALWFFAAKWLAQRIGNLLPDRPWRVVAKVFIFALLLPLPLIDEIVGGWQFKRLCEANVVRVNKESARGRTVYLADVQDIGVPKTWIPMVQQHWQFLDAKTNESILSYERFLAIGGVLIRTLSISEGNAPLIFKGTCEPGGVVDPLKLFKELGITQIQRSTLSTKELK
jgi:hypothetical protein